MSKPVQINYVASPTAADFHKNTSFFKGLRGPIGSGKSVACVMELFKRALEQKPNSQGYRKTRFAIVRASYPELKSTTIKTVADWIPESIMPMKMNQAPIIGQLTIPLPDRTTVVSEWMFIALDRPKDLAKLLSLELSASFLNETKELSREVLDTISSRVGRYPAKREGGPSYPGVIADTNSPSEFHFWADMEKDPPRNWKFFVQPPALLESSGGGFEINPTAENVEHLPMGFEYYLQAVEGKDMGWIRAYILNQYATTLMGKPVYGGQWNEQIHVAPLPLVPLKGHPVVVGLDFGLTPAAVFTQCIDGQLRVIDEVIAKRMGLEQFLTLDLLPLIGQKYFDHEVSFVGDPSGVRASDTDEKSCFDVLIKFGLPAVPAHSNALEPRLGAVRHFLSKLAHGGKPAMMVSPSCRRLIEGFNNSYQFGRIQVSGESRFRDKPEKNSASHIHDGLQYSCLRWTILLKRKLSGTHTPVAKQFQAADQATGY